MDRLRDMEVFLAVADAGSFSGAARQLAMSAPAVTRAVAALEARLGTRFIHRTTRSLNLTEAGVLFAHEARHLLQDFARLESTVTGANTRPSGTLNLTASSSLGRKVIAPVVADFLDRHQQMKASLLLIDRVVNLVEEGMDIAVRVGDLPDSSFMARRVGQVRRLLVASPHYLAQRADLREPSDLLAHDIIGFSGLMPDRTWRWRRGGRAMHLSVLPRIEVNDVQVAMNLASGGRGITAALSYMITDELAQGTLVEALPDHAPEPVPVHLVHPHSRLVAAKVRAFMEFAAPRISAALEERTA
jgi:DNA-binding transcriptional LysR family regulator